MKDAQDGKISNKKPDIKPQPNKYVVELWQREWDEFPRNKLHQIILKLDECLPSCRSDRKKEKNRLF